MSSRREGTEQAILELLKENGPMGFTDLLDSLELGGVAITRPRLSKRLKSLVSSGAIIKETVAGWPPTTSYRICGKLEQEHGSVPSLVLRLGRPTAHLLGLVIIVMLLSIGMLVQYQHASTLRDELASVQGEAEDLQLKLDGVAAALRSTEDDLVDTMAGLGAARAALENTTDALHQKAEYAVALSTEIQSLQAQIELLKQQNAWQESSYPEYRAILRSASNGSSLDIAYVVESILEDSKRRMTPVISST